MYYIYNNKITTLDVLTFCAADMQPSKFMHVKEEDIQPFLEKITDKVMLMDRAQRVNESVGSLGAKTAAKFIFRIFVCSLECS